MHPCSLTVNAKCAEYLDSKALYSACMSSFIHNLHVCCMNNDVMRVCVHALYVGQMLLRELNFSCQSETAVVKFTATVIVCLF